MTRTIVISDIHAGDKRSDLSAVLEILVREKYDRLVLNGDFVDLWNEDIGVILNCPLYNYILDVSLTKEVIWIAGNHDADLLGARISRLPIVESLLINEYGKKILILHGHQVFPIESSFFGKLCAKFNTMVYGLFGSDLQTFLLSRAKYILTVERKRKEIIDKFAPKDVDTIIIGHTHIMGHLKYRGVELFDTGSVFITRSYASIERGVVSFQTY